MEIQYYVKHVYGNPTMYIADEKLSAPIQQLTGQKTLTDTTKRALEQLGFTFTQILLPTVQRKTVFCVSCHTFPIWPRELEMGLTKCAECRNFTH